MPETIPNSASPQPCRISIRMPRPLWLGGATVALVVIGVLLVAARIYAESMAIRKVLKAGGSVETRLRGPEWLRERLGDDRMRLFDEAITVKLSYSRADDETLGELRWLPNIKRLDLNGTRITDGGLAQLPALRNLEWLWLADTGITDSGLAQLKGLTGLHELGLGRTRVTDAGLLNLKGMTGLRELWLNGTQVTDAGLVELKELECLEWLFLRNTQVTDAGVAELARALPGLRISR